MVRRVTHWREADGTTAEWEQGPVTRFTRYYWATLDDVDTDPSYIFKYKDCPKLGDRYRYNKAALCVRVKLSQAGASKVYKVEVEWNTIAGDANNDPDPLKRPAVIDINTSLEEVETFRDGKGRIMINTAGDIQVGTTLKPIQTITIQKNVAQVPEWFHTLPGSVNKSPVIIDNITYDKRTLLLGASERPNRVLENERWYYPIKFELRHDADTHDTFEPSTGWHELEQSPSENEIDTLKLLGQEIPTITYTKKRILVGEPPEYPNEPQYLDKNGKHILLQPDKKRGGLDTSDIFIIRRNPFREADLNVLPRK